MYYRFIGFILVSLLLSACSPTQPTSRTSSVNGVYTNGGADPYAGVTNPYAAPTPTPAVPTNPYAAPTPTPAVPTNPYAAPTAPAQITVQGVLAHSIAGATVQLKGGSLGVLGTALTSATGSFSIVYSGSTVPTQEVLYLVASGGAVGAVNNSGVFYSVIGSVDIGLTQTLTADINASTTTFYAGASLLSGPFIQGDGVQASNVVASWKTVVSQASLPSDKSSLYALTSLYLEFVGGNAPGNWTAVSPFQLATTLINYGSNKLAATSILKVADLDTQYDTLFGVGGAALINQAYVQALPATSATLTNVIGTSRAALSNLRVAGASIVGVNATTPSAPVLTLTPADGSILATWGSDPNVSSYTVGIGAQATVVTSSPYTFVGLANGTTYQVTLTASNAVGTSPVTTAFATPQALPSAVVLTSSVFNSVASTLDLTWSPALNATGYNIYINGVFDSTVAVTSASIPVPILGASYLVEVRASNALGEGPSGTATIQTTLTPSAPTGLTSVVQTNGIDVLLYWDVVIGATGYSVDVDNGAQIIPLNTGTKASVVLTGLQNTVSHTVLVTATVNGVVSYPASLLFNIPPLAPLAAPANLVMSTLNATTAHLTWTPVLGAVSYQVSVNGGTPVNVGTALFYDAALVNPAAIQTFFVAAVAADGTVGSQSTVSGKIAPAIVSPVTNFIDTNLVVGSPDAILNWVISDVTGLDPLNGGYIKLVLDATPPLLLGNTVTTYTFTNLAVGTHSFSVFQCNDAGCGPAASISGLYPH